MATDDELSNQPVPDYFMPSFFQIGPGGNLESVQSTDYEPNGQRGFRLYASPDLTEDRGGLDAAQVVTSYLDIWSRTTPLRGGRLRAIESTNPQIPPIRMQVDATEELWIEPTTGIPGGFRVSMAEISLGYTADAEVEVNGSLEVKTGIAGTGALITNGPLVNRGAKGAALPASPQDGQEFYLTTAAGRWHLQYESATSRWWFLGGPALSNFAAAAVNSTVNSYPAAGQGPGIVIPRAGVYDVSMESMGRTNSAGDAFLAMAIEQGGAYAHERAPVVKTNETMSLKFTLPGLALGLTLVAGTLNVGFRSPSAVAGAPQATYTNRMISATPVYLV